MPKKLNPLKHGHSHDVMINPETKKLYWPGCPACEKNVEFIKVITTPGCTDEQWEEAARKLREDK